METASRLGLELEALEGVLALIESDPKEMGHLYKPLVENALRQDRRTIECVETGEPFLACEFTTPAELLTALGVHWYFHLERVLSSAGVPDPHLEEDLEAIRAMPLPADICTVARMTLYYLEIGVLPRPAAYIPMIHPCDAVTGLHAAYTHHPEWRDVPMLAPDPPYNADDRGIDYYADEIRRSVEFITKHTGKTLDMDRLREVVEETNKGYALWQEYNYLKRSIPLPHGGTLGAGCVSMLLMEGAGRPENTAWLRQVVADAERAVFTQRPFAARLGLFAQQPATARVGQGLLECGRGAGHRLTQVVLADAQVRQAGAQCRLQLVDAGIVPAA